MNSSKHVSYAIKLLSIRDYFEKELFCKVAKKFGEEKAQIAIESVKNYGYIDDERTAKNYIRSKLLSGYGPYYICSKLYEKGYDASISDVLSLAENQNINIETYINKIATNYKNKKYDDPYKMWVKCMNHLINRGYQADLCKKLVKKGDFEK